MKEIVWRCEYGVYVPFCPYCDEPAYERASVPFVENPTSGLKARTGRPK